MYIHTHISRCLAFSLCFSEVDSSFEHGLSKECLNRALFQACTRDMFLVLHAHVVCSWEVSQLEFRVAQERDRHALNGFWYLKSSLPRASKIP